MFNLFWRPFWVGASVFAGGLLDALLVAPGNRLAEASKE